MNKTKKMTTVSLLCTLAYIAMLTKYLFPPLFSVSFLQYDPKDTIIVIGGFIYGPLAAFVISTIVSLIEMLTSSTTHIIGCMMNIASSCAFACSAAAIYSKYRSIKGGMFALLIGSVCAVATMMVLNYLITPFYMKITREAVAKLIIPTLLPFNVIKCALNSALVLLLYKPVTRTLKRTGLLVSGNNYTSRHNNIVVILTAVFMILVCTVALWIINY